LATFARQPERQPTLDGDGSVLASDASQLASRSRGEDRDAICGIGTVQLECDHHAVVPFCVRYCFGEHLCIMMLTA
jgi:hypothetical protein